MTDTVVVPLALTLDTDTVLRCLVFLVVGGFGMICHYAKLFQEQRSTATAVQYFFTLNIPATLAALGGLVFLLLGYLSAGTLYSVNLPGLVSLAFTAGYSCDSVLNSARPPA